MARCLREYPALLRLRMALEAEIAAYRYAGGAGGAGGARGSARGSLLQGDAGGRGAAPGLPGPAVTGPQTPEFCASRSPEPPLTCTSGPPPPGSPGRGTPGPSGLLEPWSSCPPVPWAPRAPGPPGCPGSPAPRPGRPWPPRRAAPAGPHTLTSLSRAAAGLGARPMRKHLNKAPWHHPEPAGLWWRGSVPRPGPAPGHPAAFLGSVAEPGHRVAPWQPRAGAVSHRGCGIWAPTCLAAAPRPWAGHPTAMWIGAH